LLNCSKEIEDFYAVVHRRWSCYRNDRKQRFPEEAEEETVAVENAQEDNIEEEKVEVPIEEQIKVN
jgi:hypothetical protein